ncbi:MAG: hypothetical protein LBH68_02730 [Bifidobacteriaceae bacterium]|jgi:hypothetical protein|nr:hypothetical protein [Bifidobacteriaceae bacterium]
MAPQDSARQYPTKTRSARVKLTLAGFCGLAMLVVACSNDGHTNPENSAAPSSTQIPSTAPTASTLSPIEGETPFTAYGPYLDGPRYDEEALQAEVAERHRLTEALIAECMAAEGFDYYPTEPVDYGMHFTQSFEQDQIFVPLLPSDRTLVEQHGYGLQSPLDPAQWGAPPSSPGEIKNSEYYETLSETARSAYNIALMGFDGVTTTPYNPVGIGCRGKSWDKYPEADIEDPTAAFTETFSSLIFEFLQVTDVDVALDSRVVSLNQDWHSCMLTKGVDVSEQAAEGISIAWMRTPSPALAFALAETEGAKSVLGAAANGADPLTMDQNRQLVGSPEEIRIALADFDCREQTNYLATAIEVQLELEAAFVARNKTALDQMVAASDHI